MKCSTALFRALMIASCLLVAGAIQTARPQLPGGGAPMSIPGVGSLQDLTQKLHLNPTQVSQLAPLLQGEMSKIGVIKNNPTLSGQEKLKQAQAVQSQTDPQVKSILDPTQYKQWLGIRKNGLPELKKQLGL